MASLSDLKQILKEDGSGRNLYDHITELLMKILIDRPPNAFDSFELLSAEVKANPLNPDPEKGRPLPASEDEIKKQLNWAKRCSELLKNPAEPPEDNGIKYPDLIDDSNLFEWANINFGRGELYRLYLSIKKFSENPDLSGDVKRIRFVGKFNTRSAPYYVIEGSAYEDEEADPKLQEDRTGANKYVYWVTQSVDAASKWIKLPNVTSAQIIAARQFKRLLVGDLEAEVRSYPPFPAGTGSTEAGREKHHLRAQLACLVGETSIAPEGFFEVDPDADEALPALKQPEPEAFNESFPKVAQDLKEASAWRHHEIELNKIGRALKMPEPEEGELPEGVDPPEYPEPTEIYKEAKPEAWTFRVCPGGSGSASFSAVVARSLVWPGAVSIYAGRRFVNVYVGNGVQFLKYNETTEKYENEPYSPPLPPPLQVEFLPTEDDMPLTEAADPPNKDPTPPPAEGEEEE